MKGRRNLIEFLPYLSDAERFAHTTWSTQEQSELRQRKQPGIKFCLSVYPPLLLKTCAGIHGPQSNSISSKSRSNITIPVKHQADTKRPPLCPHKLRIFGQTFKSHGVCLSFTTEVEKCVKKNGSLPKDRKKRFICISVCNLDLTGSSTLKRKHNGGNYFG